MSTHFLHMVMEKGMWILRKVRSGEGGRTAPGWPCAVALTGAGASVHAFQSCAADAVEQLL